MGLFTKDIKTMNDLFVHQLQDIYYAEKQLVKALPKMAEKATDKQLKQGFLSHLDETKTHVQRLEQVFQMHGAEVKAVDCPAIETSTVTELVQAFKQRDPATMFVIPRQSGKRGHPVLAPRSIAAEFLALAPTAEAREVVHAHVDRTEYVEVDDAGIFTDVDDPEAYRLLKERVS